MTLLGDRAFGFMLFILAFPNCLPMPTGFSTLTGVPMLWLAWQLLRDIRHPTFPSIIADRKFGRAPLAKATKIILPALRWLETLIKPRWRFLSDGWGERIIALIILAFAFILILPIPGANLPQAAAVAIMALGLIEADGVIITIGAVWGIGVTLALYEIYIRFFAFVWHTCVDYLWPWLGNLLA